LGASWRDRQQGEFAAGKGSEKGGYANGFDSRKGSGAPVGGKQGKGGSGKSEWSNEGGKGKHEGGKGKHEGGKGKHEGGKGKHDRGYTEDSRDDFDSRKGGKRGQGASDQNGKDGKDGHGGKGTSAGGKQASDGKSGAADGGKKGGGKDANSSKGGKGGKNGAGGGKNGAAAEEDPPHESSPPEKKKSGGTGAVTASHLSSQKFADLEISKESKRALAQGFGYEFMTNVQAATVNPMLAERDVVARARTGTGKTLAFLVPIVERLAGWPSGVGGSISAIILSPTRELAAQISEEAAVLLRFHSQLGVACFYGGTNIKSDHNALKNKPVDILVATPGRLQDHLDNTPGFRERVSELYFLALDEADQLLDMGFRDAILKILKAMPSPDQRQGALFSATFPQAVGDIAKLALKKDHDWIDTVRPDEEVTPDQIDQSVCVTDMENMTELLWKAVNSEIKRLPKEHKIMVFFTTARSTQLYSELFCQSKVPVLEIHSRKSQAHRNRCADQFRSSQSGIIFSSDVSARGLDYPDVTTVIQVGIPSAREQYIHRLGRTGRAGKSGRCILLLHDFEEFFIGKNVKDLPIKRLNPRTAFPGTPPAPDSLWYPKDAKTAGQAYQAWLGYYNSVRGLGWPKDQLVREATRFADTIGGTTREGLPPPILKKTVGMMGLKGVPGLNIVSQLPYGD